MGRTEGYVSHALAPQTQQGNPAPPVCGAAVHGTPVVGLGAPLSSESGAGSPATAVGYVNASPGEDFPSHQNDPVAAVDTRREGRRAPWPAWHLCAAWSLTRHRPLSGKAPQAGACSVPGYWLSMVSK
jgi:hypothetical protein